MTVFSQNCAVFCRNLRICDLKTLKPICLPTSDYWNIAKNNIFIPQLKYKVLLLMIKYIWCRYVHDLICN